MRAKSGRVGGDWSKDKIVMEDRNEWCFTGVLLFLCSELGGAEDSAHVAGDFALIPADGPLQPFSKIH
jgi:hypothetical protein